jgi:hypothetical protein
VTEGRSEVIYSQLKEKSSQVWVSAASLSESESFETKDFGYLLFLNASARLAQTDLDDRLI